MPEYAQVAQLVEHATENRSVGGSIPPGHHSADLTIKFARRARSVTFGTKITFRLYFALLSIFEEMRPSCRVRE
jgi:hypothetical protein